MSGIVRIIDLGWAEVVDVECIQNILVYRNGDENDYKVIHIGEYFLDFAVIGNSIYLGLVYQEGEARQSLMVWSETTEKATVVKSNLLLEENKLAYRAKHYIFRSGNEAFYYERFFPYIYQLGENKIDTCISFFHKNEGEPSNKVSIAIHFLKIFFLSLKCLPVLVRINIQLR